MKVFLIVLGVLGCITFALCGGCFIVGGTIMTNAINERQRIESAKSPEQKAKEKSAKKLEDDLFDLTRQTRELITDRLKVPDGAKFDLKTTHVKGFVASVEGTVTSANEFNARLRKPIRTTWTRTDLSKSFKISEYDFDGKSFRKDNEINQALAAAGSSIEANRGPTKNIKENTR